jgi:site-specific DNA recombinase
MIIGIFECSTALACTDRLLHGYAIVCPTMTNRAVTYCRISSDQLGTEAGVTRQQKDTDRICADNGWTVVERIVDNDRSASKYARGPREGWERLMQMVEAGEVDAVVAYDLDRLTRQMRQLERLIDAAERGVLVRTATGVLDLSSDGGLMIARVLCSVAINEADRASSRQKTKQRHDAAAGRPHWGRRPFGHNRDGTLHPAESDWVRTWVRWLVDDGVTPNEIARRMNEAQVPATSGGVGLWQSSTVKGILVNPRLVALREHRGTIVGPAAWSPIITEGERAQVLDAVSTRVGRARQGGRVAMLTGLVRCETCGLTMHRGSAGRHAFWRCSKAQGWRGCNMTISAAPLEAEVSDFVLAALGDVSAEPRRRSVGVADVATRLRDELDELAGMFGQGHLSMSEWKAARQPLERRLQAAERSVARDAAQSALMRLVGVPTTLGQRWAAMSAEDRNRLTSLVVAEVRVAKGERHTNRFDRGRMTIVPVVG